MTSTASILDVSPDEYHQVEACSATTAKTVILQSPAHAKARGQKTPTEAMERGTIIHRLVLGKGKAFEVLDFDDYRKNDAKDARDKARERGLVPILRADFEDAKTAAEKIREGLQSRGIVLDGQSELAITWMERASPFGEVKCKAMFDHVWLDRGVILDLKVTANAAPKQVERTAESFGYAIQSAAYTSGLSALRPELTGRIKFIFAFCEPESPYAINVCTPDGLFREVGHRRWMRAVRTWGECLMTDTWPAYGQGINQISPPAWVLANEDY